MIIEGKLEEELLSLTLKHAPNEAVGLILSDGSVVELVNHSPHPAANFEIRREDLVYHLMREEDPSKVSLWHSHPSGGIGPSRVDIQNRTPFASHLVVSLVDGVIVPTWY